KGDAMSPRRGLVTRPTAGRARRTTAGLIGLLAALPALASAQGEPLTRADTLRGSNTPERAWWDVVYYDLALRVNPADSSLSGSTTIQYAVTGTPRDMQIDLAANMRVDSIREGATTVQYRRDGDAIIASPRRPAAGSSSSLKVFFSGKPRVA